MASICNHVQYASINQSGAATTDLVADPGDGKRIVVLGMILTCDTAGTIYFHDDAASPVSFTGEMYVLAGTPLAAGYNGMPLFASTSSQKLQCTTTQEFNGVIAYTIDTA